MMPIFYFAMLSFFLTHELDAVKRHEWRVLPLTSFLPERTGEQVFVWAHVPLLTLLFYLGIGEPSSNAAIGLSAFAVIHVCLHWIYRNHPKNEFNNSSSWALIIGAGLFGTAHLVTLLA